jgi:RNA polymerase sigma-70 factor (ECF subfamily)
MKPDIETVYRDFSTQLERFIARRVSDPHTAEDILQDVFLRVHSQIDSLQDESKLQGWIYQITRHAIVDYYRRRKDLTELPESFSYIDEHEIETDASQELLPSIGGMLRSLPEKYRQALILTEYQGLTQQEAAIRLGLSLSGAKSRVQRAREQMKQMFLDCCHFEFDRLGKVIEYSPNLTCCTSRNSSLNPPVSA